MAGPDLASPKYIVTFTVALCGVCAVFVAGAAVGLKDKQRINRQVDRQTKVLAVAGLIDRDERPSAEEVQRRYEANVVATMISLSTGATIAADEGAIASYDLRRTAKDPAQSRAAPPNDAKVRRVPNRALVYRAKAVDGTETIIVPISGYGLWSTMYGFLALGTDAATIEGITFYEHGETPGLGGEIENARWQALWKGRRAFDDRGAVAVKVIKGHAGAPAEDPHRVDGISGATITSRGVTATLRFWLGDDGFGPYLARIREEG